MASGLTYAGTIDDEGYGMGWISKQDTGLRYIVVTLLPFSIDMLIAL